MRRPTTALLLLVLVLASLTVCECAAENKTTSGGGQKESVDKKRNLVDVPAAPITIISPAQLVANLTAFSDAISAATPGKNVVLLEAINASIEAKNVSNMVNNETVMLALSEFASGENTSFIVANFTTIFTDAEFVSLNDKVSNLVKNETEVMNKWLKESDARFKGVENSLKASQKKLEKKMNDSLAFFDKLEPLNLTTFATFGKDNFTEITEFTQEEEEEEDYGGDADSKNGTSSSPDTEKKDDVFKGMFNFGFLKSKKKNQMEDDDTGDYATAAAADDSNSTAAAAEDLDFHFGSLNAPGHRRKGMFKGFFNFDFLHSKDQTKVTDDDSSNNNTWGSNTTRCKKEKKACVKQCGGHERLNVCKESKKAGESISHVTRKPRLFVCL